MKNANGYFAISSNNLNLKRDGLGTGAYTFQREMNLSTLTYTLSF